MLLSVTGVRGGIVKYMPKSIAMASSGACGWGAGQRFGGLLVLCRQVQSATWSRHA